MPLNELAVPGRVIGEREVRRALEKNSLKKIFIATDSDPKIVAGLTEAAQKAGIDIETVDSKLKLGRACAIERSAAAAGVLKQPDL